MKKFPLVSVIIITYNQTRYVYETIDSVLQQTYSNIELIIADDHSTGFCREDIITYIGTHNKGNISAYFVYTNPFNYGTVKNINAGLKNASGEYIKIIGGDDVFFDNQTFQKQITFLIENPRHFLVMGESISCDVNMLPIRDKQMQKTNGMLCSLFALEPNKLFVEVCQKDISPFVTQATCFSREFFLQYGVFDESYILLEDTPMLFRIISKGIQVGIITLPVVKHRGCIGVSANYELFSEKRYVYYKDVETCIKNEVIPKSYLVGKYRMKQKLRINTFRCEMCMAIRKNSSRLEKARLILSYLDAIFCYVMYNPAKFCKKMRSVINTVFTNKGGVL